MKKNVIILIAIFICVIGAAAALAWYFLVSGSPNRGLRTNTLRIGSRTFTIEIASTTVARSRGLSYRESLGENEGMYFIFDSPGSYGFWMKDMNFPIDIVWIRGDAVVGFSENAQPEPGKSMLSLKLHYPPEAIDRVLEINAGLVEKYGFQAGDKIVIE